VKSTPMLFDIDDMVITRPFQRVAPVVVEATEDDVTGVAGIALFGELLDHLGLVQAADRRGLRPIGPVATPVGSATARSLSSNSPAATSSPMCRCSKPRRRSVYAAATRCRATPRSTGSWPEQTSGEWPRPWR
jgi:hypothetical protein